MSVIESAVCRSRVWQRFARDALLPWALQGTEPRGDVLEIGAGGGAMAEGLLRAHPDIRLTVTDVDRRMVIGARRRLSPWPDVTVARADSTDLPVGNESFDYVVSYLMLHHVVHWRQALGEAARVLRPNGVFVGYDLTRTYFAKLIHVVDRSPYRLVTPSELTTALTDLRLEVAVDTRLGGHLMQFRARKHR